MSLIQSDLAFWKTFKQPVIFDTGYFEICRPTICIQLLDRLWNCVK